MGRFLVLDLNHLSLSDFQVEHQYSHIFTVTVRKATNVTKGAIGDMREYLSILLFFCEPGQGGGAGDSLCIKWLSVGWWWISVCLFEARAVSLCQCSLSLREQMCRSFFHWSRRAEWVVNDLPTSQQHLQLVFWLGQKCCVSAVKLEIAATLQGCGLVGDKKGLSSAESVQKAEKKCKSIKKTHPNGPADPVVGRWMTTAPLPLSGRLLSLWTSQLNRKPLGRTTLLCS